MSTGTGRRVRDSDDLAQVIADHLRAGGTVRGIYGIEERELEAVYALGYNLYNQARWREAFQVFSFLAIQSHLERRFHIARAACLQMLKDHAAALRAYRAAYLLDVSDTAVVLRMAECLIALHRRQEARALLESIAALAADDPASAATRARAVALAALMQR